MRSLTYKDLFKLGIFPSLVYFINDIFQAIDPEFYILYSIDTYSHFLGGLSIAYSAYYALSLVEKNGWIAIQKNILTAGITLATVMTFAVWWEFYEFIQDYFSDSVSYLYIIAQPSLADTIKDLYMGMFGAIIFCIGILNKKNNS